MRPFDRSTIRKLVVGAVLLAVGVPFIVVQGQNAAADWRVGAVQELADAGLETGFPDGSFLAADPLTGYQAAVLIDRLLDQVADRTGCPAPAPTAAGFSDVPGDHWASDAVAQVAALGVGDAFPEGRFDGDATLTGYQTALLVARALASADAQVACSERAGAGAVAELRSEVGELRVAIADGSLQGPVGPQGPAGPAGPAGPVGPAGADGAVGPAGEPGERGAPGADGSVGPVGPAGPAGPAGSDGMAGSDGIACWDLDGDGLPGLEEDVNLDGVWDARDCLGPVGPAGPQGERGPEGARGPIGSQGPQGVAGPQGDVGPKGDTGSQGDVGPVGPQGPRGPIGPEGPVGATGATGEVGPIGPQGPIGPAGPQGAVGPQGPIGQTGAPGAQGPAGPAGPKGDTGDKGETGPQGPEGERGLQGPQGLRGPQGEQGPPGDCGCLGSIDDGLRISLMPTGE